LSVQLMKKAIVCGSGNTAKGLLGQLFSQSGYEAVFLDSDTALIDRLNAAGRYSLRIVSQSGSEEMFVENVRGVYVSCAEQAAREIATADIVATAAGESALPQYAAIIAAGLKLRWIEGNSFPLNVLVCEEAPSARKRLETLILDCQPANEHKAFAARVGIVQAVASRLVALADEEREDGALGLCAEPLCELPADKEGFRGEPPEIKGMKPVSPIGFYIDRKRFMQDMCRALLAYLGVQAGHETIWQASVDGKIGKVGRGALKESAEALSRKYGVAKEELAAYAEELMLRFDNPQLFDKTLAAGRNPMHAIDKHGVLTGAVFLCLAQGLKPAYISAGIAAALLNNAPDDEAAQRIRESIRKKGVGKTMQRICGIDKKCPAYWWILEFYRGYKDGALQRH
jgi:mannitol-1-phosphate 5-dehydrogenase